MLKKFRPTTAGQRHLVLTKQEALSCVKPEKSLIEKKKRTNGRNHHGHITCRHKGGGHKRFYRIVDFKRDKENIPAKVASIEYDPNRTAAIALLNYFDGEKRYILAPQGLKVGAVIATNDQGRFDVGFCMRLKHMPLGSVVHNIELYPGRGGQLVRSAGLSAQLMAKTDNGYVNLKMPSGEVRLIHENCRATFGAVSNPERNLRVEGKAGRSRWRGIRPTVRGTAMNPVDHPHGGGEGKHNGYLPQTPWAKDTKGRRTRSKKKSNKMIVKDRRK
ncbi:50S ribosomal protein L2 [Candidatus Rhabdochlamydia porcellionis]|jgi:large subunit ribosomal protein L2|uniref:Large ribosomal subunit protein uL2 n=1 Tax=Candidatus Rhabdochlamydia porcellionis TaxID=225148 RepID=A0ABX8Z196_9BACT|nr:50S ribosomal protein L2 [Candidatus Rhabdochlamydia porcellionis]QZA58307.1 50S ribosomal protein L2 [Candidatus Rhabdochlamydia porcellionis]